MDRFLDLPGWYPPHRPVERCRPIPRPPSGVERRRTQIYAADIGASLATRLGEYELAKRSWPLRHGLWCTRLPHAAEARRRDQDAPPCGATRNAAPSAASSVMAAIGNSPSPYRLWPSDPGDLDGTHYLVMEFSSGRPGAAVFARIGPLPIAEALRSCAADGRRLAVCPLTRHGASRHQAVELIAHAAGG